MISFDSFSPDDMAKRVESVSIVKGVRKPSTTFALAILAGSFIALGACFFTFLTHEPMFHVALDRVLGGLAFCLGLILVVVAGAELFTGNNLLVMAWVSQKITLNQLIWNWALVYLGNFIGALAMVAMVSLSGHWDLNQGQVGQKVIAIAQSKMSLSFTEALMRGVLCNILVCLAVWLCFAGRSVIDKIAAILFPITAFVALGFEHSVANMYFVPAGILLDSDQMGAEFSHFLFVNLIPVTCGNIIGGGAFVALIYWFIYLRPEKASP